VPSAASARPARRAVLRSLRELTRLAVTALVLAVGLGGALAVAPPPTAALPRPVSVSSRVDSIRPDAASQRTTDAAPARPRPARPLVAAPAADTASADEAPRTEPGRGTPPRRGPPAA
jgi:hypothetical protein